MALNQRLLAEWRAGDRSPLRLRRSVLSGGFLQSSVTSLATSHPNRRMPGASSCLAFSREGQARARVDRANVAWWPGFLMRKAELSSNRHSRVLARRPLRAAWVKGAHTS